MFEDEGSEDSEIDTNDKQVRAATKALLKVTKELLKATKVQSKADKNMVLKLFERGGLVDVLNQRTCVSEETG
ncbi:hypothetical protein SARC_01210 [Sphaeroforma arctica JP610]|uniref:Uncharacterized protein n=1 Tax=Sphaeroforma arctica JP610 TaxID=667725 RepID=A0A0L0GCB2_9EUKA|nr:hypothetical protein SARC_01210 [Sphaeroforma arctica JP610]KNC86630.1 hypothetical protein SARC_01210 [Sphaeroforma arctica JP610]|eukprot:XP_014160532.1 hypothetical protein SARC_01210 [Sphaeroforma arctica JP610]